MAAPFWVKQRDWGGGWGVGTKEDSEGREIRGDKQIIRQRCIKRQTHLRCWDRKFACLHGWKLHFQASSPNHSGKRKLNQTCGSINFRGVINIVLCTEKEDKIKICVAVWKNLFTNNTCRRWHPLQTFSTYRVSLYKKKGKKIWTPTSFLMLPLCVLKKVLILSSINLCVCVSVDLLCVLCNTKSHCFFSSPPPFSLGWLSSAALWRRRSCHLLYAWQAGPAWRFVCLLKVCLVQTVHTTTITTARTLHHNPLWEKPDEQGNSDLHHEAAAAELTFTQGNTREIICGHRLKSLPCSHISADLTLRVLRGLWS